MRNTTEKLRLQRRRGCEEWKSRQSPGYKNCKLWSLEGPNRARKV
jgi:hypothetical protein